ncbi:hypothetical protein JYU34_014245 [Plutella xylostella]|uniref:Protein FAM91A1 n=1 Tax=Plutella xylostella TaxID=51655 RepID=A0ABQ7Q7V7_PLUXY|nr:hypothetical protein JYU34_014245 [Plutella xylostella]
MEDEVEDCIRKKIQWPQLPASVKRLLGDSPKEYEKYIVEFSISNQLRFRGSLVRTVRKDEKKYYEVLIHNSIQRLMLFPYHLADMIVKGLRITPFIYYTEVVALLIEQEKSYDTMPNFTAADCLRLLGIGRNEYLELVAKSRSLGRRSRAKAIRSLLPRVPCNVPIQPWWRIELGFVLEEDVKPLYESEKALIDLLIDRGSQTAGTVDYNVVKNLYRRGLIYLDVPITTADKVAVPPLKGFVMNRVAGDYFETLLYKVFVSIDEHTTVAELAAVLQVDSELVQQAVSLYCRLGFARSLAPPPVAPPHPSWTHAVTSHTHQPYRQITPLTFDPSAEEDALQMEPVLIKQNQPGSSKQTISDLGESPGGAAGTKRVALLFDSTLAAYLMMGNLSPDLKIHAVTLFEVGKLCDESLDSLLIELDKVAQDPEIEGEARRYLAAALCLRSALRALRPRLRPLDLLRCEALHALGAAARARLLTTKYSNLAAALCLRSALRALRPRLRPLDLLRCEALHALGAAARARLLTTKYRLAISVAPLCRGARAGSAAGSLPHLGPAPAEAASPWMRLYLYHVAGYGPPTLLLCKVTNASSLRPPRRGCGSTCTMSPGMDRPRCCCVKAASPWMRLYVYLNHVAWYGPPTLLLCKGTQLRGVPRILLGFSRLLVIWWGAEVALETATGTSSALPAAAALSAANAALQRGPVMIQAIGVRSAASLKHVMFPPDADTDPESLALWSRHGGLRRLSRRLRLQRAPGYVTLADIGVPDLGCARPPAQVTLYICCLSRRLRLQRAPGYVTLADIGVPDLGCARPPAQVTLLQPKKRKEVCGMAKPISEMSISSTESAEDYNKMIRLQSPIESHFAVTPTVESKTGSPANGFTTLEGGQLLCEELDNLAIDNEQTHRSKESIAGSDDLIPINSSSASIEDLKKENSRSKESIDDLVPIVSSAASVENLKSEQSFNQLSDLLSPAEESISMFTQLSDKLTEMTTEGDSGVDTAHNYSDDEACKPEKWTILDLQFGIPLFDETLCEKICKCIVERIARPEILDKVKEDNEFICSDVLKFVSQCQYYPGEDMGIVKRGILVPLPRKNLCFENGRITEWTGK